MNRMGKNSWVLIGLLCLIACQPDDDITKTGSGITDKKVNEWIDKTMRDRYLWYNDIPAAGNLIYYNAPETFFTSLLSKKDGKVIDQKHHYFSTIEKKEEATKAGSNVNSTYGFEYALATAEKGIRYNSQPANAALVLYVLPDSPASEAGLKRGDWIVGVDSEVPNIVDFSELSTGNAATFYLGKYNADRTALVTDRTVSIPAARAVEDTPFLLDTVYSFPQNGYKPVGYMVYNHFSAGPDEDNANDMSYNTQMKEIFARFKSRGVEEFILDLRYNGGGLVTCAQLLTSLLAPANALGQPFCVMTPNDKHPEERREMPLLSGSDMVAGNLNLKRLYVLTGQQTASSSEAVINCLIPYLGRSNIFLIGNQTIGKTVGSEEYGRKVDYGYILHPITLRIQNADGNADYENGFTPDYPYNDITFGYPFASLGDPDETLLSIALYKIFNGSYPVLERRTKGAAASSVPFVYNSLDRKITPAILVRQDN